MKKILFAFLLICSFWNYGIGQIQYTGCSGAITAGYPYTLSLSGNDGTRNIYTSPLPGASCGAGVCAFRVIWTGSQWEIQLSTNGGASFPNTLYINTTASLPDPPDLSLGTWAAQGPCAGQALSTWAGNVQSTTTVCSNPTVPTITSTPTSICAGSSTTLSISGTLNDATNWHIYTGSCGGTQIGMTSTSSFVVSPSVTTTYFVRGEDGAGCVNEATGACGSVTVTVNAIPSTPTITGSTVVCSGVPVTLNSSAGTGNQWFLNGNPISGATGTSHSTTTGGNYTVTSTVNGCTSSASAVTAVTVSTTSPPVASASSMTICSGGGSATLTSSTATGNQWFLNGNPLSGETNSTLLVTTGGSYMTQATNGGCTFTSNLVTITVNQTPNTPTISAGGATTFCTGGSVTLTSSAGSGNQWFLNGNAIGGATNTTYSASAGGNYTVVSTVNGCASGASSATSVVVNAIPSTPTISAGGATTFCTGGSVTLTSSAGSGNQWFFNGNAIGGATNTTYSASAGGNYTVVSTVNGCASGTSSATTITVNQAPTTTISASSVTICSGGGDSTILTSSDSTGIQWFLGGNAIGGATNQTYVATVGGIYYATITSNGCSSNSNVITIAVNQTPIMPAIVASTSTTFCTGDSVILNTSSSTGNQWFLNGNALPGSTGQSLAAITGGNYTVMLTMNGCSNTSSILALTENSPVTNSQTLVECAGATVSVGSNVYTTSGTYTDTLSAANGCDSILTTNLTIQSPVDTTITATLPTLTANTSATAYQWVNCDSSYAPLAGATAQAYTPTANGNYAVIITEGNCSDTSSCYAVIVTGIKNNKLTKMLTLFPNPTSGNLTIELGQIFSEVTIKVTNVAGQQILTKSFESTDKIDFNIEGAAGVYLLEVTTNEGDATTIKVLKK